MNRITDIIMPNKTIIRLSGVARNPANGFPARLLADKVNEYLEEQGKPERIRQPFEEMDIRAQRDLLLLGSIHSDWQKEFIQEISPREWEKFQERHPETISIEKGKEERNWGKSPTDL